MQQIAYFLTVFLTLLSLASADDAFPVERVFGPELPGKYKHPASFTQLDNGDLYLVYYGGSGEYGDDTAVYGSRQVAGSKEWSNPVAIADTPDRSEGNGVVWQAPDGVVWLFYLTRYGETWSTSRIKYKVSKDGAHTWSDPAILAFEQGMMVRSRPIVLNDGDYLLPIYHETGHDREIVGHDTSSLFLRRNHQTREWTETERIYSRIGNLQPSVVQLTDDHLVAYCRRGGGYGPMKDGFIVRTESRDGGRTWSPGKDSEFPNPNAAVDFIRLRNGHLLLVYNDNNEGERLPLTAAISTDNDQSYPHRRDIVNKPGDEAAYPTILQAADDKIHLIYTSSARTVINHIVFDESMVLGHSKSPAFTESGHTTDSLKTVLERLEKEKAVLLDVREQSEWDAGHLQNADLLPLSAILAGKLTAEQQKLLPKDRPIYCHCGSGGRVLRVAELLKKDGYDVRPLQAGYKDLLEAGFSKAESQQDGVEVESR